MRDKEFEITFKKIMIKEVFKLIINLVLKEKILLSIFWEQG